jgi:hypothetical protein
MSCEELRQDMATTQLQNIGKSAQESVISDSLVAAVPR